jgi:cardiolipin synthase
MNENHDVSTRRVWTVPNALSFLRIALIPAFFLLIVDEDTRSAGLVLFIAVVSTDWVDGMIARRTGQVTELGKILDPVADRLAIAAGLLAVAIAGLFPWWAVVLIVIRDLVVLVVGGLALRRHGVRVDVRWIGKLGTASLMTAICCISWGALGLWLAPAATVFGWVAYAMGIVEYYVAAWSYLGDLRAIRGAA